MAIGELKTFTVAPDQAYGPTGTSSCGDALGVFSRRHRPEAGMQLKLVDENGEEIP